MGGVVGFLIGMVVGAVLGVYICALCAADRLEDD